MSAEPRILLADDDDIGRYVIATMLRRAGFAVREVSDGDAAVSEARRDPPDLVVLDVKMPTMGGFEACRLMKLDRVTRHVPVLLLSATFLETEAQVEGLDQGADAYLTQPVEAPVLTATIRSLLRARSAEDEVRIAEREWRATFDAISDAVAVLDSDGSVRRVNPAFEACLGATNPGQAITRLADVGDGEELDIGGRTFKVRIDRFADLPELGEDRLRTVLTLTDVTAAREVERQRASALAAQRMISRTLQASLLPERLPQLADVALEAWHVAAEQELIVGGDWYDVIETRAGVWLVMGDIAGHGVDAAAQAGRLRHSLRVYAREGFGLTETFERLNDLLLNTHVVEMATLCVATIDSGAASARIVRAGHPPPLLIPAGQPPQLVDGEPGVVLGVAGTTFVEHEIAFLPGDRLVLYTDGLVERPGEAIDDGLQRLTDVAADVAGLRRLRAHLVRELLDMSALRDDVAVLIAQRKC